METTSTSTRTNRNNTPFSLISRGWKEVRDSADADLQLMRSRANSFKNLANSFDREIENFFNSASIASFSVPSPLKSSTSPDFVKKLRPTFSEIRRAYSAPEISKKVLEKWGPRAKLGIDLSAIKNAIVAWEVDEERRWAVGLDRRRKLGFREFWGEGKEGGGGKFGEWKPIRVLKRRLREFEKKSEFGEIFGGLKNSEFVEKLKSSLKAIHKEPQESKEVPPLDVPELLAYLVRQSEPFLDQLGMFVTR
uniref:Uncharacterized protein n=1 Tax=Salix viminalis TaxID=40686 RepID=A0A6N2MTQ0_SALVM